MRLLHLPILRQTYGYDCGAKALQSVLVYYGLEIREDKIMKSAKTSENGTPVAGIVATVKKHGLKCISKQMSVDELKRYIDARIPVIICLQAWTNKKDVDWDKDWADGHYVVCVGYSSNKFFFEDPSSFDVSYLLVDEFISRWHDVDINNKKYVNWRIAVFGKKPQFDSKMFVHLD